MPPARRILITSLVLFFLSQILFLVNIQFPTGHNFDEFHYVPAAKEMLTGQITRNWEHPPLGKKLIAWSISLWGDRPIGWRYMSTIFGSLTLVGMYLWALTLFRRQKVALWVAALTLANHLLYVQARIGMLDTFMFGFLVWGLAAFSAAWNAGLTKRRMQLLLLATGFLLGLATASKWSGVVALGTCIVLVSFAYAWRFVEFTIRKRTMKKGPGEPGSELQWISPDLWKGITPLTWIVCLGLVPAVTYLCTFIPLLTPEKATGLFSAVSEIFAMQKRMWEGQLRVVTPHPYMSDWWEWPFLNRPIWYAFDKDAGNTVRGVLLLGNPLVMWGGIGAFLYTFWSWIKKGHRAAFLIAAFYSAFYFCWLVIPRKVSFYYYYYPAGMVLSLALAYFFMPPHESSGTSRNGGPPSEDEALPWPAHVYLGACVAFFIYFYPILAALRIPADSFRRWMWFQRWI